MNTIAEFKTRFQLGTQVRQIWNASMGEVNNVLTVTKVQSNGIFLEQEGRSSRGWIPFPKRSEIVFTENGWRRVEGSRKISEYVWIKVEE